MRVSAVDPWLKSAAGGDGARPYAFLGADTMLSGGNGPEELSWLLEMEEAEGDPVRVLIAAGGLE